MWWWWLVVKWRIYQFPVKQAFLPPSPSCARLNFVAVGVGVGVGVGVRRWRAQAQAVLPIVDNGNIAFIFI
jgi:hypothetical protein